MSTRRHKGRDLARAMETKADALRSEELILVRDALRKHLERARTERDEWKRRHEATFGNLLELRKQVRSLRTERDNAWKTAAERCAAIAEKSASDIGPENPAAKQARQIARLIRDHFSVESKERAPCTAN